MKSDTKINRCFPGPGNESFCVAGTGPWMLLHPVPCSSPSARHPSHTEGSSQASAASVKTVVNYELAKTEE